MLYKSLPCRFLLWPAKKDTVSQSPIAMAWNERTKTILLTGVPVIGSSDRKRARSALFSSRAKNADQDLGRGTDPSSITLRMGA